MLNVNRPTLLGNVIEDPTVRNTKAGTKVANFRVATSKRWKDKDGEQKSSRQFHLFTVFGGVADFVGTQQKGDAVYVEGELTYGSYEKDGQKVYTTDINIGFDGKVIALDYTDDGDDTMIPSNINEAIFNIRKDLANVNKSRKGYSFWYADLRLLKHLSASRREGVVWITEPRCTDDGADVTYYAIHLESDTKVKGLCSLWLAATPKGGKCYHV